MIIDIQAEIVSIYEKTTRGNNFEVTGIILKIQDQEYYVEAVGVHSSICNGFQNGNPVRCKIKWHSNQDKRDPNKYWNNINLIEMNADLKKPAEMVIDPPSVMDDPNNDLPF